MSMKHHALVTTALVAVALLVAPANAQSGGGSGSQAATENSGTLQRADRDMRQVLQKLQEIGAKPLGTGSVEETRKGPTPADAVKALLKDQGKDPEKVMAGMGVSKRDITYNGPSGDQPARVYTPAGKAPEGGWPIVVYYHGGGWVIADLDTYEASAMGLAKEANAMVVSVEYRHAPEHKFPAAHEDAIAAYAWILTNAKDFGGDPTRVALAGESAGGNLAINVAIAARQGNFQKPAHMLLVYPVAGTDMNTPSYKENANAVPLSRQAMEWFVQNTVKGPEDLQDPRLDVVGKADLKGLPPATVITAEIDPLRSEGKALADKLKSAGVDVTYRDYEGVAHEFFGMAAVVDDAEKAQAFAGKELKEALAKGAATGSTRGGSDRKQ